jgi:hypothetical protein
MLLNLKAIPRTALVLGGAGLIPFLFGGISIWLDIPVNIKLGISQMTLTYGMIILSFLGGIRWGAAMVQSAKMDTALILSVVPSLLAFASFFMPGQDASLVLAIAFIGQGFADHAAGRDGRLPNWYPNLRVILTIVVTGTLFSLTAWLQLLHSGQGV